MAENWGITNGNVLPSLCPDAEVAGIAQVLQFPMLHVGSIISELCLNKFLPNYMKCVAVEMESLSQGSGKTKRG